MVRGRGWRVEHWSLYYIEMSIGNGVSFCFMSPTSVAKLYGTWLFKVTLIQRVRSATHLEVGRQWSVSHVGSHVAHRKWRTDFTLHMYMSSSTSSFSMTGVTHGFESHFYLNEKPGWHLPPSVFLLSYLSVTINSTPAHFLHRLYTLTRKFDRYGKFFSRHRVMP